MLRFAPHLILLLLLAATAAPLRGWAQMSAQQADAFEGVGMEEKLGATIPLDIPFIDESGRQVMLADFFDGRRPVLLNLVYHSCPMLCNLILDASAQGMKEVDWTPGKEYVVLTVSFAPEDTPEMAARQKARYLELYGRPDAAAGWHFLTGSQASIRRLTDAVGFRFKWVEAQQEYAHPATLTFLTGEGKITRYLYGLQYPGSNLRLALLEAADGKVGTPLDQAVLFCFQYDPHANSYVVDAMNLMKAGGGLTLLALGTVLFTFWRRERHRQSSMNMPDMAAPVRS